MDTTDSSSPLVDQTGVFRRQLAAVVVDPSLGQEGDDPCWAVAATQPRRTSRRNAEKRADEGDGAASDPIAQERRALTQPPGPFVPIAPRDFAEAGLTESQGEALLLKLLLNRGTATGREMSDQVKLPFGVVDALLGAMKEARLVVYKSAVSLNDYLYESTELGQDSARRHAKHSTYFGAAPVPLADYVQSVAAQSVRNQLPKLDDLRKAFADLLLSTQRISQIGQAVNSGLGMFLYGDPGNGKTSIAERVTKAYGESVWIPRAINIWGEIVRLYDPSSHTALENQSADGLVEDREIDRRWVRILRPTIVVGGELTMENLELQFNPATGIAEAPIQLKSNCGTLVIDDFGRQRIHPEELLNRWIVPLEKRHDFITMASGRKIQVPFDQLVIFSTNLQPGNLVDEAFLRRIPYKIDVTDPTEEEFRELFTKIAATLELQCSPNMIDYVIDTHYKPTGRAMRFCHPHDLLHQVDTYCRFHELPKEVTTDALDAAIKNYFAML